MAKTPIAEVLSLGKFRAGPRDLNRNPINIPDLPANGRISLDAECERTQELIDNVVGSIFEIWYADIRETGMELLGEVERSDPPFVTWLDKDLSRPRRRVLAEAILLLGIDAIRRHNLVPFVETNVSWDGPNQNLAISWLGDQGSLQGRALFISGLPCADRMPVLRDAFAGLPNADFQIVTANSRNEEDDCIPDLAINQYLILVDLDTGRQRVFGHGGLIP